MTQGSPNCKHWGNVEKKQQTEAVCEGAAKTNQTNVGRMRKGCLPPARLGSGQGSRVKNTYVQGDTSAAQLLTGSICSQEVPRRGNLDNGVDGGLLKPTILALKKRRQGDRGQSAWTAYRETVSRKNKKRDGKMARQLDLRPKLGWHHLHQVAHKHL